MHGEPVINDPVTSRRSAAGGAVRSAYAMLIIALGLVLSWMFVKPAIYTESPGKVMAPEYVISTPYSARIADVQVRPGQRVRAGEIVATVRSPEIDALLANLSGALAAQTVAMTQLRIRRAVAEATLPAARARALSASRNVRKLGTEGCIGTSVFCAEIIREEALAAVMLSQTEAEADVITTEMRELVEARARVETIYEQVVKNFGNGNQATPITGVISAKIARKGQSVGAGDTIVEVLDDSRPYVQWVMDSSRFRQPQQGDPVYVLHGQHVMRARIVSLLSVSDAAVSSRSLFRPPENGQLVLVEIDKGLSYPPMMAHVEVRYNYWRFMDSAVELYVVMMEKLGIWS
jgi:multidrug resistance efflux pump